MVAPNAIRPIVDLLPVLYSGLKVSQGTIQAMLIEAEARCAFRGSRSIFPAGNRSPSFDPPDHASERSDAGIQSCASVIGSGQRWPSFSHRFSLRVELAGAVHEAVEDRIGQGRIPDHGMLLFDREPAGDDGRASRISAFDALDQITSVTGAELGQVEVVDYQDAGLGEQGEELRVAPIGARHRPARGQSTIFRYRPDRR